MTAGTFGKLRGPAPTWAALHVNVVFLISKDGESNIVETNHFLQRFSSC